MIQKNNPTSNNIDYNNISLTRNEIFLTVTITALILFMISYIFYRNTTFSLIILPLSLISLKYKKINKTNKIKKTLSLQFRDFLEILATNISVGQSIESSLPIIKNELQLLHGVNSLFDIETNNMIYKLSINMTIEDIFRNFSERSTLDDIKSFAMVLGIYRKTGGNFNEIIKNTCKIINDKIEIRQEIDLQITAKKLESRIMGIMPIVLITILSTSTGDFMTPIFTTFYGRLVMSIALIIIIISNYIAYKITDITI